MKTKLELIKNYPIESLKNWGDYFGYPENICKEMTDMTDCDWQNAKIGVLDDFGFQMIRYLINIKKVPLQNIYFLVSENDETKVELMKKWYSNFVENEISSIYNINMSFDLIIANPPYGQNATLAKDIITSILNSGPKQTVLLMPLSGFKFFKKYDWLKEVTFLKENPFGDATFTSDLTISLFEKNANKIKNYEDLNKMNHPETFKWIEVNAKYPSPIEYWEYKTFSSSHMTLEETKEYGKKFDRDRLFIQTSRNAYDNVHSRNGGAFDIEFNLKGADLTVSDQYLILFKSKIEKDNFCKWYYETAWSDKNALIRRLLKMISQTCGVRLIEMIPHVDWSRSWTDEEILKELGLPEDFL